MTTELNTLAIDQNDPSQVRAATDALSKSGIVYRAPDGQLAITNTCPKTGQLYVTRTAPRGLMAALYGREVLRFVAVDGRGTRSVPLASQAAYEAWLGRLFDDTAVQSTLPLIEGVYRLPAVVCEDSQITEAWAGPHHGRLFVGGMVPAPPPAPGYPHLRTWLSDIAFLNDTYRANLLGWVLSTLARSICPQFPFLLLDGVSRKVGKTTVADAICYFVTGAEVSPITHSGDETEFEKRAAGNVGQPGPNLIYVDNIRPKRGQQKTIRSQFLAVAATTPCPSLRQNYGKKPERIDYPIILFTMNSSAVETDLHDRTVRVILTKPGRYFKPNPLAYAKAHRPELLQEAIALLKTLRVDGDFTAATRFGTWEIIATRAAAALGLAVNYDPDAVDTGDAVVKELYTTVLDLEEDKGTAHATFTDLAERVRMHSDSLTELSMIVRTAHTSSVRGESMALRNLVEALASRLLNVDGKAVRFVVGKNSSNQYTISVEEPK